MASETIPALQAWPLLPKPDVLFEIVRGEYREKRREDEYEERNG